MKILVCPMNGPRNINEFQYFGPVKTTLAPEDATDAAWASYLFQADNTAGLITEWWRHVPSNYFFLAQRNTVTNEVIRTFDPQDGHDVKDDDPSGRGGIQ